MKNLITLVLTMSLFTMTGFAQLSFSWDPNDTIVQNVDSDMYTELDIHQINLTGDTLELGIEVVYNDIPATWDGMICIQGLCLGAIQPVGFTAQMSPIYDTMYGYTKLTVFPQGGLESCKLRIRVYDVNSPSESDTCTWILNSVSTNDINEISSGELTVFPNPASGLFKITSKTPFNEVWITDLQGRKVKHIALDSTSEIAIPTGNLLSGEYFVEVISDSELIERIKLMKYE
ncbi:MAG: T9SS type A sorting domain-containing protein [Crocinitomicaceae bacterium]|nr:T9SS type A sorting domain-containing protein [Crocinitomicaceae bacterium]